MSLFPIFLKLAARPCVVVGAGTIAESKIRELAGGGGAGDGDCAGGVAGGAGVGGGGRDCVGAARVSAGRSAGRVPGGGGDGDGGGEPRGVCRGAGRGILCNAVDDPPFCDFYFPSVVRRGELQIAISTAGESPALAMRLRKEINAALPADCGRVADGAGAAAARGDGGGTEGEERKVAAARAGGARGVRAEMSGAASWRGSTARAGCRRRSDDRRMRARGWCIWWARGRGSGAADAEGARLLAAADVVLHDDLVPEELLAMVHRRALVTSVGKRCGRPRITQAGINALMIDRRGGPESWCG